ncbi:MAG: energy transducer TonB [Motiliproteus sp.]
MSQTQIASSRAPLSTVDQFGFPLFIAIAVHGVLILGLDFATEPPTPAATTLEVTLAQFTSEKAPDKADFIAQNNQIGSGELEQKTLPTTREIAPFQNNQASPVAPGIMPSQQELIQPVEPAEQPDKADAARQVETQQPEQISTHGDSEWLVDDKTPEQAAAEAPVATGTSASLLARSLEIASLEAKLDNMRQEQASAPRIRRLTSASTRASYDAQYLDSWRRKVERVGNINYPEQARRRGLYGNLRLALMIRPDGSLEKVDVLKTSGHKVLDDAAKRIVRLAAPYAPFPPELRKHADRVEIIRTWKFERSRLGVNAQ